MTNPTINPVTPNKISVCGYLDISLSTIFINNLTFLKIQGLIKKNIIVNSKPDAIAIKYILLLPKLSWGKYSTKLKYEVVPSIKPKIDIKTLIILVIKTSPPILCIYMLHDKYELFINFL